MDNIKNDPKLFRFYTGQPNYATFAALFKSFGTAVNNLVYNGSSTNSEKIICETYIKHGPKRVLTPESELFLVLVCLRLGLLEEDLAYRACITQSSLSKPSLHSR